MYNELVIYLDAEFDVVSFTTAPWNMVARLQCLRVHYVRRDAEEEAFLNGGHKSERPTSWQLCRGDRHAYLRPPDCNRF